MDEMESVKRNKFTLKTIIPRFIKALAKAGFVYILFALLSSIMVPFESIYSYQSSFTVLFALYLFFIFVIELTKGTIFQHLFSIANSLMIVFYFIHILNTGVINFSIEEINLVIDLRFFLSLFVLGGVLGFAKNMLRLLNWMNEREEQWLKYQIKSL
ncbi:MAG: hypothetical protein JSV51_00440 [Candidatus Bathyarchaeota archaeon]|nr:MAG: hypothetical protein JSV51_00440 [Candidatus Bathyarchaeota archaeon]